MRRSLLRRLMNFLLKDECFATQSAARAPIRSARDVLWWHALADAQGRTGGFRTGWRASPIVGFHVFAN